ncbi:MAG TPA: hypothetical protein VFQ38_06825, partial [Longimicrobiales bacterium]|nr:hypothetical protein [Longimicrobiales bacterium]
LDRIVLRLLSRSAEQRFQTAEELDAALAAVEGAARARPAKRAWLPWRRSPSAARAESAAAGTTPATPVAPVLTPTPTGPVAAAPPATAGPPAATGTPAATGAPAAPPPRRAARPALVAAIIALVVLGGGAAAWWAAARDRSAAAGEEALASGAAAPLASAAGVTDRRSRATGVGTGAHPAAGDVPPGGSPPGAASSGGRPAGSAPPPVPGPGPTPQPTRSPRAAAQAGAPGGTMPSAAQRARATPELPPERVAPRTPAAGTAPSGAATSRPAAGAGGATPSTMPTVPYRDTSPGPVQAAPSPQRAAAATEPAERAAPPPAANVAPAAPAGAPASGALKLACSRKVPENRGTRSAVGTVTCRWTVPANGTTFRVERRAGGADAWEPVSTGRLSSHAGFTADFDQKVGATGSYLYRVQPCTKAGCSAPEVAAIPDPPEALSAAPTGAPSSENRITLRGTFNPRDASTVDWELSVHPTGVLLDAPRRCSGKWTRLRPEETVTVSCTPWDVVLPGHKYEAVLRVTSAGGSATSPATPFETPH